jgi:uncharacterized protein
MRDVLDDFMDELRRRLAASRGGGKGPESGSHDDNQEDGSMRPGGPNDGADSESDSDNAHDWDDAPPRRGSGNIGNIGGFWGEYRQYRKWIILAVIVFIGLPILASLGVLAINFITDAMWYQSVGYQDVFWTRIGSQVGFFALGAVVAFILLLINIWLAGRLQPKGKMRSFSLDSLFDRFNPENYSGDSFGGSYTLNRRPRPIRPASSIEVPDVGRPVFWALLIVGILIAFGLGGFLASSWQTIQLFIHRAPFGQTDPIFNKDIGFYMFELPFYRLLQSYANVVLLVSLAFVGLRYAIGAISGAPMPTAARVHIGILAMFLLWTFAIGNQLDKLELVYSNQSGVFTGVSYADANAKFIALDATTVVAALAGAFVLGFAYTRWRIPLALTLLTWLGVNVLLGFAYPQIVQQLVVNPNAKVQETPYIQHNLDMTRLAFGINDWTVHQFNPTSTVTQTTLNAAQPTIQNLRLWDYQPLQATLDQTQALRNYYSFADIDIDRYTFTTAAGCAPNPAPCVRQVMLSGRELDPTKVAALNNGDTWVNAHLTYTHGVGLAMLPVNEVVRNGTTQSATPNLIIQNVPTVSTDGAPIITQPRIYFGTQPSNYVIVGSGGQEFDFPAESGGGTTTNWTGNTGIKLDTPLVKLLFAARMGDLNLLISPQVTGSSQLLMNRSITERVQLLAPFLRYDKDPYLVVTSSGRLVYMLDAYTTSDAFPDANAFDPGSDPTVSGLSGDPFNYIRNSVKVVMDAYDGTMSFYVADPNDPIINAWQGVFPTVFHPLSQMPADLESHIRYPEDMFNAQTAQFERYHVTDPGVFYVGDDVWQVPSGNTPNTTGLQQLPLEAYYVEMQTPGLADANKPEFLLLQPMVPQKRPNMISWVAAHNDYPTESNPSGQYGKVDVYDFPADATVYGQTQMQSVIAANKEISQQITLWSQQGSTVILGNMLVVPTQNSILYVEPVFLQSANAPLPVFQKVIVATGPGNIVWGDTLGDALTQLVASGNNPGSSPSPGTSPTPGPSPSVGPTSTPGGSATPAPTFGGDIQQLIAEANQHYQLAQQALTNKDLATYQKEMNIVGQLLAQIQAELGTPAPSASH